MKVYDYDSKKEKAIVVNEKFNTGISSFVGGKNMMVQHQRKQKVTTVMNLSTDKYYLSRNFRFVYVVS